MWCLHQAGQRGSCNYNILFVCRRQNKLCLVGTNILVKFMNVLAMGSHRNNFMIWTYNNNHKPVWRQYQYVRMHIGVNLWGLRPSWSTIRHIIRHFYAGSQPQSARTHVAVKSELEPASITTLQHNTTGRIWLALCTLALQLFAMFNLRLLFARYRKELIETHNIKEVDQLF